MYLKLVFFLLVPFEIIGFNIDTNNYVVYVDPQKTATSSPTYFGYTVVLYPGDRNSKTGQWIKIGAPKGQEPNSKFKNTGVIYDCPFMKKCNIVNIKKGDGRLQFDNSWIGGSMDISYKFQKLSICGFRVIFKKPGLTNKMAGACYLSDLETNKITENMPFLQNMRWRYRYLNETTYYYELGEAGFAAHHPQDEDVLLLGAPGVFNWAGTLIKVTPREVYIANPENSVVNYANDLFGYSITSGYYNSRTKLYYVATTPKSYDYKGKVAVVQFNNDKPLKKYTTITGHQFGEYFGASTTSGDLNGDNFDDLVIGAPFHKGKTFNEGAVYIFLGGDGRRLQLFNVLHGEHPKGQFGSAVMFLGDINNDGFGDLAIGAPYEEEYSGVLYIYKGNKEGVDSIYCQRIIGKRISPGIQGFGISISRPADIDQNGYNDLVVGAHLSGNAILLRTRPVVVVKYEMKSFPEELREDTREFILNVCYWYTLYNETKIILSRTIRVDELGGRAFFTYPKDRFKLLNVQPSVTCENITVSVKNTTNYNSPITVSLSYQLVNQQNKRETVYISDKHVNGVDKFCARCPVLDKYRSSPPSLFEVPISLGCGPDNICQSVLSIDAIFPDLGSDNTFVVGSQNQLNLQAKIKNSGENAYSTQLAIILPDSIHFRQFPTECEEKNISTIICNVGNPLRNNSESSLVVNLDMKKINKDINHSEIIIILKLLTLSVNSNPSERNFTIGLRREADIMISGKSGQQSVPFNRSTDAMLNFSQIYQVEKIGASPLEKVQINISLPLSVRIGSKEVKFIKVYPPDGIFAGQSIDCRSDIEYVIETNEMSEDVESDVVSSRSRRQAVGKNENSRDLITETKGNSLGHNRTVYLNCSVEDIVCYSIVCTAGPFEKKQTPATIEIRMMLDPSPISHLIEEKYVIIYSTQGSVLIQVPAQFIQNGNRPDFVEISNLFINETIKKKNIALWIIILAAVIGILLLVLIILGLVKLGFFKRTKKEELENLKAMAEQIATEPAPHDPDQVESPSLQIVEEYEQEETKEIK